ncbi:MAG: hotdog fold thioesterase [Verrucomicrobia bacterium]|nr:hotdog fold thioesterase [Verrucomicrobiota bacterium]MDE3047489.1 hotdog fold thioesterase [Verrucomicrobiota bacterium]
MIWKIAVTPEELNHRCRGTLVDHLGIEFIEVGKDHLTARMPVDKRTVQPAAIVHGGATAALAETVASAGANYCIEKERMAVGLELNINHIRTVRTGYVIAVAKPLHLGKSTQVWEIKITNEEGQLISAARLTVAVMGRN